MKFSHKTLVITTGGYPYGNSEPFLEEELEALSKAFNKIALIPDVVKTGNHRDVPDNVIVKVPIRKTISLFNTFFVCLSNRLIRKEFLRNLITNPLRNKVLLKTLQRALQIKDGMDGIWKDNNGNIVLYSYWLDHNAIAFSLLNHQVPRVSRLHGWDVYAERQKYRYLPLRPFLFSCCDILFPISQNGITYLESNYDTLPKIELMRLGVSKSMDVSVSQLPFTQMVSISNLIEIKRIGLIGEVYQRMRRTDLTWEHYGSGHLLDQLKEKLGQDIFKGQVDNSMIRKMLLSKATNTFLINVSSYEGIPVSMMEAMSFGIPCIGTDVGGVSEIIEDGYNGFLLPANPSIQEIVDAINRMLTLSGEEAFKMRQGAYKTWKEKYNAEENYLKFADAIGRL